MIKNPKEGMKVKVIANSNGHDYILGATYSICGIFIADETCRLSNAIRRGIRWCPFSDLAAANQIGWDWLRDNLPSEAIDILGAFDGLDGLILKEEIANALVSGLPDLRQRILDVTEAQANQAQADDAKSDADAAADDDSDDPDPDSDDDDDDSDDPTPTPTTTTRTTATSNA